MFACAPYAGLAYKSDKNVSYLLKTELHMFISYHVGSGSQTQAF